jgi:Uncharacterized protein conserved in cyanobacteria
MELRNNNYVAITEEEFLAMGDSVKAEYCNGQIIYMQSASPKHERIRRKIEAEFAKFTDGTKCSTYGANVGVRVHSKYRRRIVNPDVFIQCDNNFDKDTYNGVPLIIVEILSPATASNDEGNKKDDYAYIGVREYLIVDQEQNIVKQYKLIDDFKAYALINEYTKEDTYRSIVFADLQFDVIEIFKNDSTDYMPDILK